MNVNIAAGSVRNWIGALALLACASGFAADPGGLRGASTRSSNWIIGQYDHKKAQFGTVAAPDQMAIVVKALCDSARDYKEANGPYISETVKKILAAVNEKGEVSGSAGSENESVLWIITALKSTNNEKYADVIAKLRARGTALGHPAWPAPAAAHLAPTADAASLKNALALALKAFEDGKKEIELDGKPVAWAGVLADNLLKLQQPDGSFGPDITTNALALITINTCFKSMTSK
jgi:hypothetical protein